MGLFNFFKGKKVETKDNSNEAINQNSLDDFTRDMIKSAEFFVSSSKGRFSGLDFSVKSLEIVDNVLEEASDFYDEMDEKTKQNLISSAGSYIFEVARQNFGGKYFWYDHLSQPILVTGQPKFEVSIVTFDKVKGRLENGKEDNIPFYFAGYIEQVEKKGNAMIV